MDVVQEEIEETPYLKVEDEETDDTSIFNNELGEVATIGSNENINNGFDSSVTKYECEVCDEIFEDELCLEKHAQEYHKDHCEGESEDVSTDGSNQKKNNKDKRPFKCEEDGCGASFRRRVDLRNHQSVHSDERPFKCTYEGCLRTYKVKSALGAHVTYYHLKKEIPKLFKCSHPYCGSSFKTNRELQAHVVGHSDCRPFKCTYLGCNKAFKRQIDLDGHVVVHSDEKPFECYHCEKTFKRKRDLRDHMTVHTDERPFKCNQEGCDKAFKTANNLRAHIRLHNDDYPFKCSHAGCGKAFKRKGNMETHQLSHLEIDPNSTELILCDYPDCTSSFRRKKSYNKHMQRHRFRLMQKKRNNNIQKKGDSSFNKGGARCTRSSTEKRTSNSSVNLENQLQKVESANKQKISSKDACQGDVTANIQQCSLCKEKFNDEKDFEEHVECCGIYFKCEFVDYDQCIAEQDQPVDVELECQNNL